MKKSRYTEEQIIGILKQHEAGVKTADLCREHVILPGFDYCVGKTPWAKTASIQPRHRGCHATFIQENQVFRRDRADALDELFPLSTVGFRIPLGGVERLFLRRTPSRFSTLHT